MKRKIFNVAFSILLITGTSQYIQTSGDSYDDTTATTITLPQFNKQIIASDGTIIKNINDMAYKTTSPDGTITYQSIPQEYENEDDKPLREVQPLYQLGTTNGSMRRYTSTGTLYRTGDQSTAIQTNVDGPTKGLLGNHYMTITTRTSTGNGSPQTKTIKMPVKDLTISPVNVSAAIEAEDIAIDNGQPIPVTGIPTPRTTKSAPKPKLPPIAVTAQSTPRPTKLAPEPGLPKIM